MLQKKLSMYRAIILDMDGTLYYQFPLRVFMAFELLLYYLIHFTKLKELFMITRFRKSYNEGLLPQWNSIVEYWMDERPLKYVRIFRDKKLLDLVGRLQNNGAVIITYSDYPLTKKIDALRPFRSDYTFCAADSNIQCLKPAVNGIEHIIRAVNMPAEDFVFIGDRYDKDGKCARGVGMDYLILSGNPIRRRQQYKRVMY